VIKVEFVEPASPAWQKWKKQCRKKTEKLIANGPPYEITGYYKKERDLLFAIFHFKCAYCECLLRPGQIGDVEHFRPKSAIADIDYHPIHLAPHQLHPGYFWLAYEAKNLLAACQLCNETGLGGGKRERFPLLDESKRAMAPGEEVHESPALINPVEEDPSEHFTFCTETGILGCATARAKACEKVFNLNREDLCKNRFAAYWDTRQQVKTALAECLGDQAAYARVIERLQSARSGAAPFALACRQALRDSRTAVRKLVETLMSLTE
jgi:hypothetical protein